MLSWLIFKNYLLSRRSGALVRIIAWHCIIGIGMGVAALVIVLSVMNGFNLTIRDRMFSVSPHVIVNLTHRASAAELESLTQDLQSVAAIDDVARFETQDLILRSMEGTFSRAIAKGYDPETLRHLLRRIWMGIKNGAPDTSQQALGLEPDQLLLGVDLARSLGIFEGDEVVLIPPETLLLPKGESPHLHKFRVKALLSTQMQDLDANALFYTLGSGPARLQNLSLETGYEIRLKNPADADRVKAHLLNKGFKAQTWAERDISLFFALKMESFAMTLFLCLAVLITSFSIVIVMVLLMSQKRRDIGMLRALGLSVRQTRIVFLRVGLLLSFAGICGGLFLGTTVCLALDAYPLELLPDIYTDSTLPAKLTLNIFTFVLLSSSAIAIIGSWLPVWRYVVDTPSNNLRTRLS